MDARQRGGRGEKFDLLVIGAGMAGLTAALQATELGATVCVVERAPDIGGSGKYASFLWTAADHRRMDEVNPLGDPTLRSILVEEFKSARQWVADRGIRLGKEIPGLRVGRGNIFDAEGYIRTCARQVEAAGGQLLLAAEPTELI